MSSFKVLKLNEMLMVWLRIYPYPLTADSIPINDFFQSIASYYISLIMLAYNVTSGVFLYQNASDIVIALRTSLTIVGTCQSLGMFLTVGCKIDKVKLLHRKLQAIVDQAAEGIFPLK